MAKRKPPSAKTYSFHQPAPKVEKPKVRVRGTPSRVFVDVAFHRPNPKPKTTDRPSADTIPAKPTGGRSYTFHTPDPKAFGAPNGSCWTFDGDAWLCDYGCKRIRQQEEPKNDDWHAYDCPYWRAEGILETPF